MRALARGRGFMAAALLALASAAPWVEEPLTADSDLHEYSHRSVHAAHAAFVEREQSGGPIISPEEAGIVPVAKTPYIQGVRVSSWTEDWFGPEGGLTDRNMSTMWETTNIPAMVEFDLQGYYRLESFEIHNGFPSGAARVRLYAWAKPDWLRIQVDELMSGEVRVTPLHPTLTPKVRISFQTYHMGGVNLTGVRFRGLSSVAVIQAMSTYDKAEYDLVLRRLVNGFESRRSPDPSTCPVLERFPNPTIHDLAIWAVRQKGCMCAHHIVESLRPPSDEEQRMMQHMRRGYMSARALRSRMGGGKAFHRLVNETIGAIDYLDPPPQIPNSRANASYHTPFNGEGITAYHLSLAEISHLNNLSLAELTNLRNEELSGLSIEDLHSLSLAQLQSLSLADAVQPDSSEWTDTAERAAASQDAHRQVPVPDAPVQEEEEDDPADLNAPLTGASGASGSHLDPDVKMRLEEELGIKLEDVNVVCAAMSCMIHAMRTAAKTGRGDCLTLLSPLCNAFRGLSGCEQSCDLEEAVQTDDGCLPMYTPLGNVGFSYDQMAHKANLYAGNLTTHFNYTEYMEAQGYHVGRLPDGVMKRENQIRVELAAEKARA